MCIFFLNWFKTEHKLKVGQKDLRGGLLEASGKWDCSCFKEQCDTWRRNLEPLQWFWSQRETSQPQDEADTAEGKEERWKVWNWVAGNGTEQLN